MKKEFLISIFLANFVFVGSVNAASLFFGFDGKKISVGDNFTIEVAAESSVKSMNAVDGSITYSEEYLEAVSIQGVQGNVNLWLVKPDISKPGIIDFQGAILNPGYIGAHKKLFSIEFKGKKIGVANLIYSRGIILANDGMGTNISGNNKNTSITIIAKVSDLDKKLVRTENSKAVYYISGGKRYIFLNEQIYKTWYSDFSTVQVIGGTKLAEFMIGGLVKPRPNKLMIKIKTDPKVYLVSDDGKIRWIATEKIAKDLFGSAWAKKIVDISDAEISGFELGSPVERAAEVITVTHEELVI